MLCLDLDHLGGGVLQLVDPVDEDDDIAGLQVRDQSDQPHVGRGQGLMRRQHDNADPAVAHRPDRHLLAHQEGVVHAGRVADAHLEGHAAAMQIQIGRAGDVGEPALLAVFGRVVAEEIVAKADVAFQQVAVEIAVVVFLTQQQFELLAKALAGLFAHRLDLLADLLHLAVRIGALGQLAQTPALAEQAVPLVFLHQLELGADLAAVGPGHQVKRRDDRGPGVHVRRQKVGPAGQRVDQRGLAGLDLTQNGDRWLKRQQVSLQLRHRSPCRLARNSTQFLQRGFQPLGLGGKVRQRLQSGAQAFQRRACLDVINRSNAGDNIHVAPAISCCPARARLVSSGPSQVRI